MAVFRCGVCEIMIVENVDPTATVKCPSCGKPMVPKAGPAAPDLGFPDTPKRETVFDFEVPDTVKKLDDTRHKRKP